jgi:hypothetical protein
MSGSTITPNAQAYPCQPAGPSRAGSIHGMAPPSATPSITVSITATVAA